MIGQAIKKAQVSAYRLRWLAPASIEDCNRRSNLSGYQQDDQSLCKSGLAGEVFLFSKSSLMSQLGSELKFACLPK
jgi:hypothetical protein